MQNMTGAIITECLYLRLSSHSCNISLRLPSEGQRDDTNRAKAQFVDDRFAVLVQRVTSVMAIADELKNKGMIHNEKYSEIRAEQTSQGKMRKLFEALNAGGDRVKKDFYYALRNHEPYLFRELAMLLNIL
ncbi:hypothetical protein cypCar_00038374 [Cyprinus carpio]|nr:hypothetical protein cypCar_00038374 [Cyprinus carpio]